MDCSIWFYVLIYRQTSHVRAHSCLQIIMGRIERFVVQFAPIMSYLFKKSWITVTLISALMSNQLVYKCLLTAAKLFYLEPILPLHSWKRTLVWSKCALSLTLLRVLSKGPRFAENIRDSLCGYPLRIGRWLHRVWQVALDTRLKSLNSHYV